MEIAESSTKKEHLSINISHDDEEEEEDTLLSSIKQKMESISLSHSLSRVPAHLLKGNEDKYFPQSVSIGPLHHNPHSTTLFHRQKWRYLNAALARKPDPESTLSACLKTLRHQEQKARNFYAERINMTSDQFVEMLLLDGCFVIELFLVYMVSSLRRRDDVCFATNEALLRLRCDLILYENQVPFFVLEDLFHILPIPKMHHPLSLIALSLHFFKKLIPNHPQDLIGPPAHHLLDLIRQHFLPTSPQLLPLPSAATHSRIPPATRLQDAGISVEKSVNPKPPCNITFSAGRLSIPSMEIHSYTEILLRNLIAMEQCQPGCSKHVTSYVTFFEQLATSRRDVRLLQEREIVVDGHGREEEIAFLFKRLRVDVVKAEEFCYGGVCEGVSRHRRRKRDVWWVGIRDLYHRSKLGIAGLSLAAVVLVFLFAGALFAAVSYLLHHFQ